MFQTDQASAVASLPAPAPASTQGFFTNGNPGTGLASTVVDADFLNMMMMELTNVVLAVGLTPSKTTYNQLLASIRILIGTGTTNYGVDSGTINAYAATFPAPVLSVADGLVLSFNAAHANTGNSTFTPNPGVITPAPVWGGNLAALSGGEIAVGFTRLEWNAVFGSWILLENTGGAQQVAAGSYGVSPPANDRSKKLVTAEWVQRNYKIGEVKMWHGLVANIASAWGPGWQLADGTNGTANLKDRFIVGAGATYAPNQTGGSTTITIATVNMPAHNHVINIGDPGHAHAVSDGGHAHAVADGGHSHGVNDPGHAHALQYLGSAQAGTDNGGAAVSSPCGFSTGRGIAGTFGSGTGIFLSAALASVGIFGSGANIGIFGNGTGIFATSNNTGSGTPVASLPPYYALCFIEYTGINA